MSAALTKSHDGVTIGLSELLTEAHKVHQLTLHLKRPTSHQGQAIKQSTMRGRGMEFLETRAYVPPDEMRHIDWRVSARFNGVYTKVFIEEKNRPIYIIVDLSPSMFFGSQVCFKSVLACKIAARLGQAVINGQDILNGIICSSNGILQQKPGAGKRHLAEFLSHLAQSSSFIPPQLSPLGGARRGLFSPPHIEKSSREHPPSIAPARGERLCSVTMREEALKRLQQTAPKGSAIFLISDFIDFDNDTIIKPLLFSLKRRADIFFMRTFDPLERKLQNIGPVRLAFGGITTTIDTSSQKILTEYEQMASKRDIQYNQLRNLFNIPSFDFATSDSAHLDLSRLFLGKW